MADKAQQPKEVVVAEKVEKSKAEEKPTESVTEKIENGDQTTENGNTKQDDSKDEAAEEKEKNGPVKSEDKCSVKRKSTGGGDATDNAAPAAEEASPEKKAKLAAAENTEADSKGEEAEVAA